MPTDEIIHCWERSGYRAVHLHVLLNTPREKNLPRVDQDTAYVSSGSRNASRLLDKKAATSLAHCLTQYKGKSNTA
jgi:hypothetical protein